MITQSRPKRNAAGARYHAARSKKLYEMGNEPTLTRIGSRKRATDRIVGGRTKTRLLKEDTANVFDKKAKKYAKAKIKTVLENPANRHYVRRNIITKGTIIETELGRAVVTNRPGQEGVVNAVLI